MFLRTTGCTEELLLKNYGNSSRRVMPIWLKINDNQFIARYERDPRDFAHLALTARLAASLRCSEFRQEPVA